MPTSRPWRAWYSSVRWLRMREWQLANHPLCAFCLEQDLVTPADVVDHVKPHKGDAGLFWDAGNLQSLCKVHHDSTKQRIEMGQTVVVFGPDGWPVEP